MSADDQRQPLSAGTDIRAAVEAGEAAATPKLINTDGDGRMVWVATVPWGGEQVVFNPEEYEPVPRRPRGTYTAQTVESLIAYTQRHADANGTATWVDMDGLRVTSVLDDNGPNSPGWGDHRVELALDLTPEWKHWLTQDGDMVGQERFANHIEDGVREIVTPDAATMLEIAQTFTAHTDAQFRQATRLQSGEVKFRYDEETTARAGQSGELDVPSTFTLAIAPFLGEPAWQVTARLRYRVKAGSLVIGYRLDRPELVLREAIGAIHDRLAEALDTPVFTGTPTR